MYAGAAPFFGCPVVCIDCGNGALPFSGGAWSQIYRPVGGVELDLYGSSADDLYIVLCAECVVFGRCGDFIWVIESFSSSGTEPHFSWPAPCAKERGAEKEMTVRAAVGAVLLLLGVIVAVIATIGMFRFQRTLDLLQASALADTLGLFW